MTLDPRSPVLVGSHQLLQRVDDPREGLEPLEMMTSCVEGAARDAGSRSLLEAADLVCVIRGRWRYPNPAAAVAERVGATRARSAASPFGGNVVQAAVNRFASEIVAGERDVVVLTGAEIGRSQSRARKLGVKLSFSDAPGAPDLKIGEELDMVAPHEIERGLAPPIVMYPIFENAIRHARGESLDAHRDRVARLWSRFNAVAVDNPDAWIREPMTAEQIATPSPGNRMLGFPYPLLMNSNDKVDMGAALLLCSAAAAERHGVPRDRWLFVHAGSDAHDTAFVSNRQDLHSSPAIRIAGGRALELAGVEADALDRVDLYSCFPSAVQVAAAELGLSEERPLTVTGGLTFGGGPLNNYVMHGIARMRDLLLESPGQVGLCTGNGGFLTKHAFGVYSSEPPAAGYRHADCQAEVDRTPRREAAPEHRGEATLESYTVVFGEGGPERAHAAFLLPDGRRSWANSDDRDLALSMTREEFCGRRASLDGEGSFRLAG